MYRQKVFHCNGGMQVEEVGRGILERRKSEHIACKKGRHAASRPRFAHVPFLGRNMREHQADLKCVCILIVSKA